MPIVQIHLLEGRSPEQKRAMVKAVTQAIVDTTGAGAENVRIIVTDMAHDHYAFAGVMADGKTV